MAWTSILDKISCTRKIYIPIKFGPHCNDSNFSALFHNLHFTRKNSLEQMLIGRILAGSDICVYSFWVTPHFWILIGNLALRKCVFHKEKLIPTVDSKQMLIGRILADTDTCVFPILLTTEKTMTQGIGKVIRPLKQANFTAKGTNWQILWSLRNQVFCPNKCQIPVGLKSERKISSAPP